MGGILLSKEKWLFQLAVPICAGPHHKPRHNKHLLTNEQRFKSLFKAFIMAINTVNTLMSGIRPFDLESP